MWAFNPHPFEGRSACGTLGLPEELETQAQDRSADEQGKNGVGSDDLPNGAETSDDDGTSFGQQAGGGDGRSLGSYLLYKLT